MMQKTDEPCPEHIPLSERQRKDRMQEGMVKHVCFHLINIRIATGKKGKTLQGI